MAQENRVNLPGLPHYVAQFGRSGENPVFREPTDHRVFLHLLEESCDRYEVAIWGYTLLARSYSLILVPECSGSLGAALRRVDSEYAHYHNLRHMLRGTVWNGTYLSTAMCWSQVWDAILFVERDPVREAYVGAAWAHPWSSAPARLGRTQAPPWLGLAEWGRHWTAPQWTRRLQKFEEEAEFSQNLTAALHSGTALGETLALVQREALPRIGPRRASSVKSLRVVGGAG